MKLCSRDFEITNLEDELRVDELCRELLLAFYHERIAAGLDENDATRLANSADFFVRDYLIGARQLNLLEIDNGDVRRFAGNWYIVNTLEPSSEELAVHLDGICAFYRFLAAHGAVTTTALAAIEQDCAARDFYAQRIDDFWNISGDGYYAWEAECSLKNG